MDAAARFPVAFPADALAAEVGIALGHVAQVREIWPEVEGWINFPLFNQTGAADDLMLAMYPGEPRPTPQAATMPAAADVVRALQAAGFAVKQARVAVLAPGEVLRCHVDMYPADRLIVPLNDQDQDFRHVFGDDCVAMGAGELWGVAGHVCHGAAHVGADGARVALLVDADPTASTPPAWYRAPWRIPAERRLVRPALGAAARAALDAADDEAPWLRAPFQFDLTAEAAYDGLIAACERRGQVERAAYWRRHACVCVPVD
ncbi:MAG: aspartyl/asparaginyl beta-hydroxylase domain-containing protein [Myxococcales bacterium]|nr:aspartyl/asparaginyl beta-hydroxylase domain-containing protein [Myxococcales bacterium]